MKDATAKQAQDSGSATAPVELAPPDLYDPVLEAYKKDVDRTLLRENLKLTVEQRLRKAESFHASLEAWRQADNRPLRQGSGSEACA